MEGQVAGIRGDGRSDVLGSHLAVVSEVNEQAGLGGVAGGGAGVLVVVGRAGGNVGRSGVGGRGVQEIGDVVAADDVVAVAAGAGPDVDLVAVRGQLRGGVDDGAVGIRRWRAGYLGNVSGPIDVED